MQFDRRNALGALQNGFSQSAVAGKSFFLFCVKFQTTNVVQSLNYLDLKHYIFSPDFNTPAIRLNLRKMGLTFKWKRSNKYIDF